MSAGESPSTASVQRRTVLVTGAASGIGLACAAALTDHGWNVVGSDHAADVERVMGDIGAIGEQVDVTSTRAVDAWVERHGDAGALVTSAGICGGSALVESDDEEWLRVLDVNLMGTMRVLRAFARARRARRAGGAAVLVASNNAFWPARTLGAYCASKAGVLMLGRTAASELGADGIRVNVLAPGETDTPMTASALENATEVAEIVRRTPLGRLGQPDDVARCVRLLLSDDAAWITGQLISADGGISLRGESDLTTVDFADGASG